MKDNEFDYSDWKADPKEIEFDKHFNTVVAIGMLVPSVLGGLYLWHII